MIYVPVLVCSEFCTFGSVDITPFSTTMFSESQSRFSSCIGISKLDVDPRCGVNVGDARFRVKGDNDVLREWQVKGSPEDPTCFEIDITGIEKLELETDLNGTRDCDISTWADAKILKKVIALFQPVQFRIIVFL